MEIIKRKSFLGRDALQFADDAELIIGLGLVGSVGGTQVLRIGR